MFLYVIFCLISLNFLYKSLTIWLFFILINKFINVINHLFESFTLLFLLN